jgi:hypothetical protein
VKPQRDQTVQEIMADLGAWVKSLAEQAQAVSDAGSAEVLETEVHQSGRRMLGRVLERLLQSALDRQPEARECPRCGERRRHKGRRSRGVLSCVGDIKLTGVYWYCGACGLGEHATEALAPESVSGAMRQLVCLLGTTQASFMKASAVCQKVLGASMSDEAIRRLCLRSGRQMERRRLAPTPAPAGSDLTGSCDGTMVHTREEQWRECKAYLFTHDAGQHGGAYLERSEQFTPRLRAAAIALKANESDRVFFVSDAADWIDKGVAVQLPSAIRIIDIWHAYQHIHEAARHLYGPESPEALAWGKRWCERLRAQGGRSVWRELKRRRYKDPDRQAALDDLLGYLDRQADRMDYPTYEEHGYPISSGPMESMCKQLGRRLKGSGMRWSTANVTPMAALISLWINDEWDAAWKRPA